MSIPRSILNGQQQQLLPLLLLLLYYLLQLYFCCRYFGHCVCCLNFAYYLYFFHFHFSFLHLDWEAQQAVVIDRATPLVFPRASGASPCFGGGALKGVSA